MSQHRFQTKNKYLVSVGIDRNLGHIFATVLDKSGKPAKGFQPFINFPMTETGISEAVASVELFVSKSEPGWTMPLIILQGLKDDLEILDAGGEIGNLHVYDSPGD